MVAHQRLDAGLAAGALTLCVMGIREGFNMRVPGIVVGLVGLVGLWWVCREPFFVGVWSGEPPRRARGVFGRDVPLLHVERQRARSQPAAGGNVLETATMTRVALPLCLLVAVLTACSPAADKTDTTTPTP
ncbi:hypothetical protein N803_14055 [Knoellia subterranea KCTC 19937]|uniref:Uncharacterized protein n=1 Tax=Knoellia subterranea KCTC 19937 TaxID=1385521 RepID=A0A0A0JKI3_9MICO|nr:hypothetical protein N803_14055 [Knoellia subterranea KCTC 19937]